MAWPFSTAELTAGLRRYFAEPTTVEELTLLVKRCHEQGLPARMLGGGSNLLVSDQGVEGLVIHLVAKRLWDWSTELDRIAEIDEAFPLEAGRGDQARSSTPDPRDEPRERPISRKSPASKRPPHDRNRIHLDRPTIKIASRDFH